MSNKVHEAAGEESGDIKLIKKKKSVPNIPNNKLKMA